MIPEWVIVIIGLGVGGLFTMLGYLVNGLLEQRREKARLAHEDIRFIREAIAKTYIENAIEPIQRDLASNLVFITEEISSRYVDLGVRLNDTRYSGDLIELLDKISASKLQWDKQAKAIGIARLELFGDEFPAVALAGYRAIELYYKLACWLANDLKEELKAAKGLSAKSIERMRYWNGDGLFEPCVDIVVNAIRDLDLLSQAIPAVRMESHLDVIIARGVDIEPLVTLRKLAKRDAEEFEKLRKSGGKRGKRKVGKGR